MQMKTIEKEINLLEINKHLLRSVAIKYEPAIKLYFVNFQLKPMHRLIFKFSDYPDIFSNNFEHREYTEHCEDMESYFRANLFHLMNQNKKLIWRYQTVDELNEINAFLYVFYKPLFILAERISYSINISRIESYQTIVEFLTALGLIKHYLHSVNITKKNSTDSFDELTTIIALYFMPLFWYSNENQQILIKKLHEKLFKRSPHKLLMHKDKNETMLAFVEIAKLEEADIKALLKKMGINEYELL
jgi:hypothetical protein